jgi:RNA-directed DNA polymerase
VVHNRLPFLDAGVLANGVVIERHEGTPQGGPLSPLLANVLLDEVDKELERRGHTFVRYADDLNVYVRSQRAGERVMASLCKLFGKLKLRINENKSKVTRAIKAEFLGFSFWIAKGRVVRRRVAPEATERLKERVRELSGRSLAQMCKPARNLPLGMEGLLPAHGGTGRARRHRRVGPPSAAGRAAQALEARPGHLSRADCPRHARRCGQASCWQQSPLVAQLGDGAQQGAAEHPLQPAGSSYACQLTSTHKTARCGPACRVVWQGTQRPNLRAPMPIITAAAACCWMLSRRRCGAAAPKWSRSI